MAMSMTPVVFYFSFFLTLYPFKPGWALAFDRSFGVCVMVTALRVNLACVPLSN